MAVTQSHFRFGVNELAEATHGWYANEDVSPAQGVIPLDTTFLLRFCLQCDGTALSNIDAEFQYRLNGGTWTPITPTSNVVRAVTTGVFANGANTTRRLSGTGTFETSSAGCTHDGISGGTAFDIVANGNGETECALQILSANVVDGDLIEFRLTRDGGVLLNTYAVTPSVTVEEAAPEITGSLAATLGALAVAAAATVAITGTLAASLGVAVLAASGQAAIEGTAGGVLGALTLQADGTVADAGTNGSLSVTLGALQASATGEVPIRAELSRSLGALTATATGTVAVQGAFEAALGQLSVMGAAQNAIAASLSTPLGTLMLASSGQVATAGQVDALLGALTLQASDGSVVYAPGCGLTGMSSLSGESGGGQMGD